MNTRIIILYFPVRLTEHTCAANPPTTSALDSIAATPLDVPLSQQEDRVATSFLKRKMAQMEDGVIQFKTGGQVFYT